MVMKYSDLTQEQKDYICNGCGGKGGWVPVPEFIFHASCNHHDFLYWTGNTESDREKADKAFYKYMKIDIAEAKWYKRAYYRIWAWVYYEAVRECGCKFFNYGSKKRTMEDLVAEVSNAHSK